MNNIKQYLDETINNNILLKTYDLKEIGNKTNEELYEISLYFLMKENYLEMIKYLKMASNKNDLKSIKLLGLYYLYVEDNSKSGARYLLNANGLGDNDSLYRLVEYFYKKRHDTNNNSSYIIYYMMAAGIGYVPSMHYLGKYYEKVRFNDVKMLEYYKMAIQGGNERSISRLIRYYKEDDDYDKIKELIESLGLLKEIFRKTGCWDTKKAIKIYSYEKAEGECSICYNTDGVRKPCHENHLICEKCLFNLKCRMPEFTCCICRKSI